MPMTELWKKGVGGCVCSRALLCPWGGSLIVSRVCAQPASDDEEGEGCRLPSELPGRAMGRVGWGERKDLPDVSSSVLM